MGYGRVISTVDGLTKLPNIEIVTQLILYKTTAYDIQKRIDKNVRDESIFVIHLN